MTSEVIYNMVRVLGSEVWLGVDIERKQLMMQTDNGITIIADFRSTEAAVFVDIWLVHLAKKFAPQRRRRWFR